MIAIHRLLPEFSAFWNQAQGKKAQEQETIWHEVYEREHPEIFDLYFSEFASRDRLSDAIIRFHKMANQFNITEQRIVDLIHMITPQAMNLFGTNDEEIDLNIVIMVGGYGADGFTTNLHGKPTVFYMVEVLSEYEMERLRILIAHELCHEIHGELLLTAHPEIINMMDKKEFQNSVAKGAFMEGIATCGSKRLFPQSDEYRYLFFRRDQWGWCQRNKDTLIGYILNDLENKDGAAVNRYFWSNEAKTDLPYTRTGYYVGYLAVEQLLKRHTFRELTAVNPRKYPELIRAALTEVGHVGR